MYAYVFPLKIMTKKLLPKVRTYLTLDPVLREIAEEEFIDAHGGISSYIDHLLEKEINAAKGFEYVARRREKAKSEALKLIETVKAERLRSIDKAATSKIESAKAPASKRLNKAG